MTKFIAFFCIVLLSLHGKSQAQQVQKESLRCGENKVETMYPETYFRFNSEVETGSIEFIGKVYDKTTGITFRLTRSTGEMNDLNKSNSVSIRFVTNSTKFDSKSPDGKIVGEEKIDQNALTQHNYRTSVKVIIGKENYDIYVNGVHQHTYGRVSDAGDILQSASLSGPFHFTKVILYCGANQPEETEPEEQETTQNPNC
ncbi:unnamed protein product [Caenorhabditis angaria]|uniref:Galectin n=1 Tax=Caenorhabditis angaria TaxID=860376 RepID=A0A9P1II95_9PELO|nr:unnamed protein product [Caenorhabditis angaria]